VHRLVWLCLVLCATRADAEPCAQLSGDPKLVNVISEVLAARGVACSAVHATVERRSETIVVATDAADGAVTERVVRDPATAATVIESWTRGDVAEPLLAIRLPPRQIEDEPTRVREVITIARPETRGIQLFGGAETSVANDRTEWLGAQIGACVMVGPVCAAARLRFAAVAHGPGVWHGTLERRGTELLVGGDVPIHFGRATFSPGFAGGIGQLHTHVDSETFHMGSETGGLRADVHAALSYPLGQNLSFDLSLAVDFTQATHVEVRSQMPLPEEPLFLIRLGAGLRYGRL
jgi:hypothetical protein